MTETKKHRSEEQRTPIKINITKSTPRHSIFELQETKDKKEILKEARGKEIPYL